MSPPAPGPDYALQLKAQRLADLLASVRVIVNPLAGITSGPGNQGSANTAHLAGQAGTAGVYLSLPREVGPPGIGGGTPN